MRAKSDHGVVKNEAYVHNNTKTEGWNAVVRVAYKGTRVSGPYSTKADAETALITLQDEYIGPNLRIVDGHITNVVAQATRVDMLAEVAAGI